MSIGHNHNLTDRDLRFSIDTITREVTNASNKVSLMQFDHNSERFSFEIDKDIAGHDVLNCNRVIVHYCNTKSGNGQKNLGVYEVKDLAIHPKDNTKVCFSWLISENATQLSGTLSFLVEFSCVEEDEVVYRWNSSIFNSIVIYSGMNNDDFVAESYSDLLVEWESRIEKHISENTTLISEHIDDCDERIDNNIIVFKTEMRDYVNQRVIEPTEFASTVEVASIFIDTEDETDFAAGYVRGYNDGVFSASSSIPEIFTAEEMDQILANATIIDVGKAYIYSGETTDKYENHAVYIIKEN